MKPVIALPGCGQWALYIVQYSSCAGIALGGGLGLGGSRVGPSVDSVLGIDVVSTWQNDTADWDIVRINATSHPDLFWGMLVKPHRSLQAGAFPCRSCFDAFMCHTPC